jgi:hypothetical protein
VLFYLQEHSTKWFYWNGNYYLSTIPPLLK